MKSGSIRILQQSEQVNTTLLFSTTYCLNIEQNTERTVWQHKGEHVDM